MPECWILSRLLRAASLLLLLLLQGGCFSEPAQKKHLLLPASLRGPFIERISSVFTSVYPHRDWVRRIAREVGETVR
jgi:hypothetical protein